jgi:hypothetical protein
MAEPQDSRARERELEDRVRRLEAALAERPAPDDEDALADRVIARLSAIASERERNPDSERMLVLASPPDSLPEPPQGAVLHPPAPAAETSSRAWFFANLVGELRLLVTMYFDPRYRISRTAQFALPGIFLLLVFNYFFFSVWVSIAFLSPVTERLLAVILGVLAYKLLTRELARYREVLAYLARYGRQ